MYVFHWWMFFWQYCHKVYIYKIIDIQLVKRAQNMPHHNANYQLLSLNNWLVSLNNWLVIAELLYCVSNIIIILRDDIEQIGWRGLLVKWRNKSSKPVPLTAKVSLYISHIGISTIYIYIYIYIYIHSTYRTWVS